MNSKNTIILFVLALTAFLASVFIGGSYAEDYTSVELTLFSGNLNNPPCKDFNGIFYIGIQWIFEVLYTLNKETPWFLLFHFFSLFVAFIIYVYILMSFSKNDIKNIIIVIFFLIVLFYDNILNINLTRESILLVSAAFLLLIFKQTVKFIDIIIAFFCIILGMLIRAESAFLTATLVGISIVPFLNEFYRDKKRLLYICVAMGICISFLFCIMADRLNSDNIYLSKDIQQYLVADSKFNLDNHISERDSIIYVAVRNHFLMDTAIFNKQEAKELLIKRFLADSNFTQQFFENINYAFAQILKTIESDTIFMFFIALIFISIYYNDKRWWFLCLLFFLFVFTIAYSIRMEFRVLNPFLLYLSIFIILKLLSDNQKAFPYKPIVIVVSIFIVCQIFSLNKQRLKLKEETILINNFIKELNDSYADSLVFLTEATSIHLLKDVKDVFSYKTKGTFVFFDLPYVANLPQYVKYHSEICNCNPLDFREVANFMNENKEKLVIISTSDRISFLHSYFKIIHNIDIHFKEDKHSEHINKISDGSHRYYYVE